MLKYMLTTKCDRNCEYCITKNVNVKDNENILEAFTLLLKMRNEGHVEIMLTGGEPTMSNKFLQVISFCKIVGFNVYVTSQNKDILDRKFADEINDVNAITFSLHDSWSIPYVKCNIDVYASILDEEYYLGMPLDLKKKGYKGLTINENQRNENVFDDSILPSIEDFTYKINRVGHCMDEIIILPNLEIINNFKKYL